jgi:hypothetical protein
MAARRAGRASGWSAGVALRAGRLTNPASLAPATAPAVNNPLAPDTIEIVLLDGSRVRVGSGVNLNALRRVVTALRG